MVMKAIRPVGGPEPKPFEFEELKQYGTIPGIAIQYLEAVADHKAEPGELRLGRWADQIRENLPGLREKTSLSSSAARRGNPTRKQRDGIAKVKPESGS